jgi:hypothetical protein
MNCELMLTTHWTYMHIFRYIFLSNYWWQRSDIWSQASYRYPISWEAFLDPSDSYINSCWEKCNEKCAYMFNVYKNQQSRQTGSRNLTGPKSLPTISSDSYFLFADFVDFYTHWTYMLIFVAVFSATIDGRNLIFGHKLHIGTPYRGKRFLTRQIPTSCLPKSEGIIYSSWWGTYMKLVTKYQISAINSCWEKCDEKCAYMFNVYKNQLNR